MKYTFSILIVWLLIACGANGQEVLENNPPSVKFYKISTPHFKVLYPKDFELQAQRVANSLEQVYQPEARTMLTRPRRIPVILQNQSAISNGFVTLTPRRSEFFTMPPQDYNFSGTNDWLDQLVSHEYRHVAQYQRVNTGFNRLLYYAFGPATLAAMATASVPQWLWEGDAVATETAFTHSGRGRIPNFGLLLRTNLQEGRVFGYNKQYLRSYKHNISDHYVFGYHMVGYLRKRTGDVDVWGKVMQRTARASFLPFRFSGSVKKISGLTLPQLYRATAEDLKNTYAQQLAGVQLTPFEITSVRKSDAYTSYYYPQALSDGSVIAMKNGIGDFTQFVLFRNGKEEKSFIPGVVNDAGMLSAAGTRVVWSEFEFDPRWQMRSYSVIKSYDFATNQYKVLTRKTRYACAAISPEGSRIATVESANNYSVSVVVIDSDQGSVIKKFSNPANAFYSMVRWSPDGKKIVALKTQDNIRSVVLIDYESGVETVSIKGSDENIGHPVLAGKYVLFNSPVSGIDNIYAYDLEQNLRLQVTSAKYGSYNPALSADGKTLYYDNQSRDGLDVVSVPFDPAGWKPWTSDGQPDAYVKSISEQEGRPGLFDSIPDHNYESKRYAKVSGLFNPYSWGAYFNSSFTRADIGISSQDVLSTTVIKAGYLFDINERTGAWQLGVSYQGWYPIIDVDFRYATRSVNEGTALFYAINTTTNDTSLVARNITFDWVERTLQTGLRLPLVTTRSKYYSSVTLSNYVGYTHVSEFRNSINNSRFIPLQIVDGQPDNSIGRGYPFFDYAGNGNLLYNHAGFSAYRLLKQSRRDINSKWGQSLTVDFFSTPYGGDYKGSLFSAYGVLYFPGLFKHHSFWGYGAYQHTQVDISPQDYIFRNNVPIPRGHSVYHFENFYSFSANYTLPVWYPDASIGPFLYVQRFRANAFYDYGFGDKVLYYNVTNQAYASVGGELRMDFNVMRFLPQLNVGVRYAYGLKPSMTQVEILLGLVNF